MTEYTRPATWEDVKTVADRLNQAGVAYVLAGGYAIAAHGFNRFSEDIDIVVDPSAENSKRWIEALSSLPDGAAKELAAQPDVFADDTRYAVRINDEFTIDVMPSIAGLSWISLQPHVITIPIDQVQVRVLDLHGLLLTKQGMRPKDQMDAAVISAALEALADEKK